MDDDVWPWGTLTKETDEAFGRELSVAEAWLYSRVLDRVPAVALVGSGMGGRAKTTEDVLANIQSIGKMLSTYMQETERLREELSRHNQDLETVRRVFGTLRSEG